MRTRSATIALLLAALAAPPALAADRARDGSDAASSDDIEHTAKQEKRVDEPEKRSEEQEKRAVERIGDDLASCKRDADGMRGPERSRFMTKCLRERK
ncbi:MAG TPA: hypothetical protein VHP37_25980 [Burkholderiales bacterium]|nr:hypothetical protein [Burkholderiales bacterium]